MRGGRHLAGLAILALAAAVALEARTFVVSFPTDPLGPGAFPLVAAALLALGGGAVLLEGSAAPDPLPPGALRRIVLATGSFVAYALLLAPLGFVTATTLEFAAVAVLFGGRPLPALGAGLGFALALFFLFVHGLGLPLPLGFLAG